jgi:hypothetical protein
VSDDLFIPPFVAESGLTISKYAGPETDDGQTRIRVQVSADDGYMSLSIDQWLALGYAVQVTCWERRELPICYDTRCQHKPPPHGRWPDCPTRDDA